MITRCLVLHVICLVLLTSIAPRSAPAAAPAPDERLNIILFLVDDLGWQHVSVRMDETRTPANDLYRTPNLESLAARGLVLTSSYASAPNCTPTRVSILTGQCPARSRITSTVGEADHDATATVIRDKIAPRWQVNGLQPDMVTLPGLLSAAGYRTIHVGKTHLAAKGTPGADATRLGFDLSFGEVDALSYRSFDRDLADLTAADEGTFLTEALAIEAGKAIGEAVTDGHPFFLLFATYAVHTPITLNPAYGDRDAYRDLAPDELAFATMVETMDAALGSLTERLETLGVADRTVIIFTSDNGGLVHRNIPGRRRNLPRHRSNAPLREGKGTPYEGGLRVPTVIAWPGVTDGGDRSDAPVISHDLFPTILGLAGVDVPADHAASVDGLDLRPLLRGDERVPPDRPLYWNFPHPSFLSTATKSVNGAWYWEGGAFTAMRAGRWKLIYLQSDSSFLLFDLEEDLGETTSLAAESAETVRDLGNRLGEWCRDVDAQMITRKWTGGPAPYPDGPAATYGLETPSE